MNNNDQWSNPLPASEYDLLTNDQLLMKWDAVKKAISEAQELEREIRKAIVKREFPDAKEGMNNKDLGNGYTLKAGVKFNYNLADNETVEKGLDKIAKISNEGSFIADRLVSWKPSFLLTEYRALCDEAEKNNPSAKEILKVVSEFLTITEATPTLEIREPKAKKK